MRLLSILALLLAAMMMACGDDDGDSPGTATTVASATEQASDDASATPSRPPTPTPTPRLVVDGRITVDHPLVLTIIADYISRLPPVAFTDPIACEGINEKYDEASAEEQVAIQEASIGRLCVLLSQSTFEEATATVVVGLFQSDSIETLNMELRDGAWVIASVTTPEPF